MSYNVNSFINQEEANALKQMIFERARERANAMNQDVQSDVMDIARESFVSKNNPFSNIIESAQKAAEQREAIVSGAENGQNEEIGFPKRELKARAAAQERVVRENVSASVLQNTMNEARVGLSKNKGFIGALDFLNSQAAVSLMRVRTDKFDVIA